MMSATRRSSARLGVAQAAATGCSPVVVVVRGWCVTRAVPLLRAASRPAAGTIELTSPPKRAMSRMYFDARNEFADADGRNRCARPRRRSSSAPAAARSRSRTTARRPLTMKSAPTLLRPGRRPAWRTGRPRRCRGGPATPRGSASRSSSANSGSPFCGLRIAATTTSSNRRAAVSMISRCPLWIGSNEPG